MGKNPKPPKPPISTQIFFANRVEKRSVETDFEAIADIFKTEIFEYRPEPPSTHFLSNFKALMLHLHDLLQKLDKLGLRINWTDDVPNTMVFKSGKQDQDITSLVRWFRIAIAHPELGFSTTPSGNIHEWNIIGGHVTNSPFPIFNGGRYDTDYSLNIGQHCIYMKHHIVRVYLQLQDIYRNLGVKFDCPALYADYPARPLEY